MKYFAECQHYDMHEFSIDSGIKSLTLFTQVFNYFSSIFLVLFLEVSIIPHVVWWWIVWGLPHILLVIFVRDSGIDAFKDNSTLEPKHQSKFSTFFLNPSLTYVPTFFPSRPCLHFLWPETTRSARKIFSKAAYHCTLNDISNQILQSHFDEGRDFYIQDIPLLFALLYF